MKYLFETHAHTSEASPCAQVGALDVIKEYKEKGYRGIIFTDHVSNLSFGKLDGSWKEKIDYFYKTFDMAKKAGDEHGLKVLCGMEICLGVPGRDYLAYGFEREFLYKYENVYKMKVDEFFEIAQQNDILLVAAHPFRYLEHILDAKYIHGVEVLNGNPRVNSDNNKAKKWATENAMIQLAGSDFHRYGDISTGVYLSRIPKTSKEFVQIIRSGEYDLTPKV